MTAQEAQTYVDKGWNRWIPVTAALVEIEKAATQPQPTDPEPQPTDPEPQPTDPQVDQTVIDAVTDWRDEQAAGTQHYERWDRVLAAFGTVDRTDAMTAQEAQTYVDKGWQRWVQIVDVLEDIEAAAQQQPQQSQQQQTCNWEDPNYVNPPSCFAAQQLSDQQRLDNWKNRIIPPSDLEHLKWLDSDLYDRIVSMYPLAIHHITDVQNDIDDNNPITSWSIPEANWILYISLTENLKRLASIPSECRPSNVECDFHDNGRIENLTKTGNSFVVNQGTQWEKILTPITILIYDEHGYLASKTEKYGDKKESFTLYFPDTNLPLDHKRYYTDGTTIQTHTIWNSDRSIFYHLEKSPDNRKVYEIMNQDRNRPGHDMREIYYWDPPNPEIAKSVKKYGTGVITENIICSDPNSNSQTCDDTHTTKFWPPN